MECRPCSDSNKLEICRIEFEFVASERSMRMHMQIILAADLKPVGRKTRRGRAPAQSSAWNPQFSLLRCAGVTCTCHVAPELSRLMCQQPVENVDFMLN